MAFRSPSARDTNIWSALQEIKNILLIRAGDLQQDAATPETSLLPSFQLHRSQLCATCFFLFQLLEKSFCQEQQGDETRSSAKAQAPSSPAWQSKVLPASFRVVSATSHAPADNSLRISEKSFGAQKSAAKGTEKTLLPLNTTRVDNVGVSSLLSERPRVARIWTCVQELIADHFEKCL